MITEVSQLEVIVAKNSENEGRIEVDIAKLIIGALLIGSLGTVGLFAALDNDRLQQKQQQLEQKFDGYRDGVRDARGR